jgi:hypothetical protein
MMSIISNLHHAHIQDRGHRLSHFSRSRLSSTGGHGHPDTISAFKQVEEETLPKYNVNAFSLTRLSEVLNDQYEVVAKLGYGVTAAVWLARIATPNQMCAPVLITDWHSLVLRVEVVANMSQSNQCQHPIRGVAQGAGRRWKSVLQPLTPTTPATNTPEPCSTYSSSKAPMDNTCVLFAIRSEGLYVIRRRNYLATSLAATASANSSLALL